MKNWPFSFVPWHAWLGRRALAVTKSRLTLNGGLLESTYSRLALSHRSLGF